MAKAEMRGLIERADGSKMERARERMEAVRATSHLGYGNVQRSWPAPGEERTSDRGIVYGDRPD
ncbi:MAG TPA: hypothetical protein VGD59_07060 [Acidisarcina sp.]